MTKLPAILLARRRQPRTLHVEADGVHYWAPNPAWRPSAARWLLWRLRDLRRRGQDVVVPAGYVDVGVYTPPETTAHPSTPQDDDQDLHRWAVAAEVAARYVDARDDDEAYRNLRTDVHAALCGHIQPDGAAWRAVQPTPAPAPLPVDPVCTCPENEAGRLATYTCRMGTEPHRVSCPRWGMPIEALRRLL